jgi:hypothetical protein
MATKRHIKPSNQLLICVSVLQVYSVGPVVSALVPAAVPHRVHYARYSSELVPKDGAVKRMWCCKAQHCR